MTGPVEEPQTLLPGNLELAEKGLVDEGTELSVDEVIEKHVGSLGWSQLLHVVLVSLAWIFDSQHTLVTIFSDAQPPGWRCTSPLCNSTDTGGSVCRMAPGTWEWTGGNKTSIVAEWSLVCDRKFLAAIPASLFFIGSLLGSSFFGVLADGHIGRKKAVLLSCILTSATAFLTALSPNIWVYALLRAANGFARSGIGICCIVLSTEAVGRKWRGQVGQYGFFLFTAGFLSLPVIAYPTRNNWRNLYKILSLMPLAYSVLLLPFVSESPRWLLVRGRSGDALNVLEKLARLNGRKLPTNLILSNPSEGQTTATEESLWRTKWAATRMVILMVAGFGIGFVYYGVQLNVGNLNFNLYFSTGLNALMEIPAVVIGGILLSIMNRRLLFSMSAYVAGVSSILCIIFTHGRGKAKESTGSWLQLIIEGIGFMAASIAFDVLYIYCVELFPTNVRNFAVSQMRQTLMLGASIAPLLVVVGHVTPSLSFIIFGVLSIISGIVSWWLPETRNAPLYQTLKQQAAEEKQICGANNSTEEPRN